MKEHDTFRKKKRKKEALSSHFAGEVIWTQSEQLRSAKRPEATKKGFTAEAQIAAGLNGVRRSPEQSGVGGPRGGVPAGMSVWLTRRIVQNISARAIHAGHGSCDVIRSQISAWKRIL